MKTVYLIPVQGLKVRHPQGGHLAEAGDTVVLDGYWRRHLAAGSVVQGKPSAKKAAKKETTQ